MDPMAGGLKAAELLAKGTGGFVVEALLSSSYQPEDKEARMLVCSKIPNQKSLQGDHYNNNSAGRLFDNTAWPPANDYNAFNHEYGAKYILPYKLSVPRDNLMARLRGEGSTPSDPYPPVCSLRAKYPTQSSSFRTYGNSVRRSVNLFKGKWVRAVLIPRKFNFGDCAGWKVEVIHLTPLEKQHAF